MSPEIIERPKMLLAGIINCGKDVRSINIPDLWNVYLKFESEIENRIEASWYELHVGEKMGNGIYSVLAGAQIEGVGKLPIEVSLKIIPEGKYAHFVHSMKEGGFNKAFAKIDAWVEESGTAVKDFGLQYYDRDFDPNSKESILQIFIPLDD